MRASEYDVRYTKKKHMKHLIKQRAETEWEKEERRLNKKFNGRSVSNGRCV